MNAETNLTELELILGKVTFCYQTGNEKSEEELDEQVFFETFSTLQGMTELLQEKKLNAYAKEKGYQSVSVDCVAFIHESEDKNTKVETLMMDEITFTELTQ